MWWALFRKDVRMLQPVLVLALIALPLTGIIASLVIHLGMDEIFRDQTPIQRWSVVFLITANISVAISYVTVVVISGAIVAEERQYRTAEFLACLPPARRHVLVSKLSVIACVLATVLITIAVLNATTGWLQHRAAVPSSERIPLMFAMIPTLIGVSGVAFALSCLCRTSLVPILVALVSPMFLLPLIPVVLNRLGVSLTVEEQAKMTMGILGLFGIAGFACGSLFLLLRKEA